MNDVSLYQTLGVARDCSAADIKSAYRNLAKDHHPDAGGDPELFREICAAYEILSDPVKRRIYDETGDAEFSRSRQQEIEGGIIDVIALILEAGDGDPQFDIIETARNKFNEGIRTFKNNIVTAEARLKRWKRLKSRIRFRGGEGRANILETWFDGQARGQEHAIEASKRNIAMAEDCLKYLDGFEDGGLMRLSFGASFAPRSFPADHFA